jgi:S1-C subfamily serine protease
LLDSLAVFRPEFRASTIRKAAERCHSSVVVVVPLDKDNKPLGQGSGFIIANNKVVTNHHVLADATSAAVIFADGGTHAFNLSTLVSK